MARPTCSNWSTQRAERSQLNLAQALFGYSLQPGTGYLMTTVPRSASTCAIIACGCITHGCANVDQRSAILPTSSSSWVPRHVVFGALLDDSVSSAIPFLFFVPVIVAVLIVFGTITTAALR